MAGSRKGEKRGGAKSGPHKPKFDPLTGTIKPKRGPGRPKGSVPLITGEREREMLEIITGQSHLMPREAMLTAMRTMFELAAEYRQIMLMALRRVPRNDAERRQIDSDVMQAENQMTRYMTIGGQMARDCAPYIHPRLAALAIKTDRNTESDLFDQLLDEIDRLPRLRAIEHVPAKKKDEEAA